MPNPIAHFDIAADDLEATRRFYERVFGWTFEAWGPPDFYLIWTGEPHAPGLVHGSMSKRNERVIGTAHGGFECTLSVDDLGAIKSAVAAHGGKIVLDEYEIVGVGRMIKFADPSGNVACAMRYVRQPQP